MIPERHQSSVPRLGTPLAPWAVPAALGFVAVSLQGAGTAANRFLGYDRPAIEAGQLWRLLTGNFVHIGWWHLALNVLSLLLLVWLCPERLRPADWIVRLLVLASAVGLGLWWFSPSVQSYAGLSGMIYGLFALGLGRQAWAGDMLGAGCLAFVLVRIILEVAYGASASEVRLIGGQVVAASHVYGVGGAAAYAVAGYAVKRLWNVRKL